MSCGTGLVSLCVKQGSSYSWPVTFTDSNGNFISISGWSGYAPIKSRYGSTTVLESFNLDFSVGASGILTMSLDRDQTAALPVNENLFEVELYPSVGSAVKYLWGYLNVSPQLSL